MLATMPCTPFPLPVSGEFLESRESVILSVVTLRAVEGGALLRRRLNGEARATGLQAFVREVEVLVVEYLVLCLLC